MQGNIFESSDKIITDRHILEIEKKLQVLSEERFRLIAEGYKNNQVRITQVIQSQQSLKKELAELKSGV